jgi:2-amino-4-hydroxy-6-hydroxymethyldihydropteridine diphosphokinase
MVYFLSLGSNLGEREQTLRQAMQQIEQQIGPVLRCSSFYYSEPWGFDSPNTFCNLCCAVETTISPLEVLHTTQAIERALGRTHKSTAYATQASSTPRYADRTIDIDLIRAFDEHGQEVMCQIEDPDTPASKPLLVLPHPLWQQRDFVMVPLAEIMKI